MEYIKLKKDLLNILKIEDILYTQYMLKHVLKKILKKNKTSNMYYIPPELQAFLNESIEYISIENLLHAIKNFHIDNMINFDYYSYNQKPNYTIFN